MCSKVNDLCANVLSRSCLTMGTTHLQESVKLMNQVGNGLLECKSIFVD